jgi:hypothetical protein
VSIFRRILWRPRAIEFLLVRRQKIERYNARADLQNHHFVTHELGPGYVLKSRESGVREINSYNAGSDDNFSCMRVWRVNLCDPYRRYPALSVLLNTPLRSGLYVRKFFC